MTPYLSFSPIHVIFTIALILVERKMGTLKTKKIKKEKYKENKKSEPYHTPTNIGSIQFSYVPNPNELRYAHTPKNIRCYTTRKNDIRP